MNYIMDYVKFFKENYNVELEERKAGMQTFLFAKKSDMSKIIGKEIWIVEYSSPKIIKAKLDEYIKVPYGLNIASNICYNKKDKSTNKIYQKAINTYPIYGIYIDECEAKSGYENLIKELRDVKKSELESKLLEIQELKNQIKEIETEAKNLQDEINKF